MSRPSISVVIPTRGRETRLVFALEALAAQSLEGDRFEVIVVRDSDVRGPFARAPQGLAARFLVRRGVAGPTAKRNVGWRAAKGSLVAFTDDDCLARPDWLESLLSVHARHASAFLQGVTTVDADEAHLLHGLARSRSIEEPSIWHQACNVAFPRALLEQLDGFDEAFEFGGEDTDLGLRALAAGAPKRFVEDAVVEHAVLPRSPLRAVREAGRWSSMPLLFRRHPQLRGEIFAGVFLSPAHALAPLALLGLIVLPPRWKLLGTVPFVLLRLDRSALRPRTLARQLLGLPSQLVADLAATAATVRSSVRHRVFLV